MRFHTQFLEIFSVSRFATQPSPKWSVRCKIQPKNQPHRIAPTPTWKNICKPKFCGGLGIKRPSAMNSAMPEKIGWSLTHDFDKPWVKAIKAKHFSCSTFMQCQKKKNCSNLWPTLLNTRNTLTKRLCYKVGRGNNVNMWEDHWIPNTPGFKPTPKSDEMTLKQRIVQSLKNHNG